MKYYETKIGQIIENEFDSRMDSTLFSYILRKGIDALENVTEEDIEKVEGNGIMPASFCQALVRCAVRICKECNFGEIIEYIRLHMQSSPVVHSLEICREEYRNGAFDGILHCLGLDDEQVGDSFSVYAVVDESTLKEE